MCAASVRFLAVFACVAALVCGVHTTQHTVTPHSTLPECISSNPRLASAADCSIFTVSASSSVLTES